MDDETQAMPLVLCGDPVLRRAAGDVAPGDIGTPEMGRLVAKMRVTMEAAPGVGLAAPQVGIPLRLAVLQDEPGRWGQLSRADIEARERLPLPFTVMFNPVFTPVEEAGFASFYEGCLSVPGLTGVVKRYRKVIVEGLDEDGRQFCREYSGWPARVVQHELDHLAGVLYLDRVETRSISTVDNHSALWVGRDVDQAAEALGFSL